MSDVKPAVKVPQQLTIRNFMGVRSLSLRCGKINLFEGPNAVGKSGPLEAIAEVLAGGGKRPQLIHLGADKAEVLLDLGEVAMQRTITGKGSYLKVDGLPKGETEAAFLKRLVNPLAFNPVEFFQAKPAERRALLLSLAPCKVTREELAAEFGEELAGSVDCGQHGLEALAQLEKLLVDKRRDCNAVRDDREGRLRNLREQVPEDFDAEAARGADVSALQAQIMEAGRAKERLDEQRARLANLRAGQEGRKTQIAALEEKINQLREQQGNLKGEMAAVRDEIEAVEEAIAAATVPDVSAEQAALEQYTTSQRHLKAHDDAQTAASAHEEAAQEAARLEALVSLVRSKPAQLLEQAQLPFPGLQILPDAITLNGVDLELLSSSEKLLFGLNLVRALCVNDPVKIACLDGLEALDEANFALLMQEMQNDDFFYFVNRVRVDKLVIETTDEDGTVRRYDGEGNEVPGEPDESGAE